MIFFLMKLHKQTSPLDFLFVFVQENQLMVSFEKKNCETIVVQIIKDNEYEFLSNFRLIE